MKSTNTVNCYVKRQNIAGFKGSKDGRLHESFALLERGSENCIPSLGGRRNSAAADGSAGNYRYEISFENITQQGGDFHACYSCGPFCWTLD